MTPTKTFIERLQSPVVVAIGVCLLIVALGVCMRGCVNPADVDPAPGAKGLHVLIVEETADRENLPASQIPIFSSIELREWYAENCAKEGDQPAYRCFDKDDKLDRETPVWRELRDKLDIEPPAFIAINGRTAAKGKLPQDVDAWKAQLEKLKAGK